MGSEASECMRAAGPMAQLRGAGRRYPGAILLLVREGPAAVTTGRGSSRRKSAATERTLYAQANTAVGTHRSIEPHLALADDALQHEAAARLLPRFASLLDGWRGWLGWG